jgi:nicotinamidase-related amidase
LTVTLASIILQLLEEKENLKEGIIMKNPAAFSVLSMVPEPITINPVKSALLVLELSQILAEPGHFSTSLAPGITKLLVKARAAGMLIIFTVPEPFKGTTNGQVYSVFERRPCEPVFFPPAFDKFSSGQIQPLLSLHDIRTLVITGSKANMAVFFTTTRAVTEFNYNVVIPVDGIAASTEYEKEYTLYQFRSYANEFTDRITFTKLELISFALADNT